MTDRPPRIEVSSRGGFWQGTAQTSPADEDWIGSGTGVTLLEALRALVDRMERDAAQALQDQIDRTVAKDSGDLRARALVAAAAEFAEQAHEGQTREHTGEPYITHPQAVARLVADFGGTDEMQAAALLHDVIEMTPVTIGELRRRFAAPVPEWVLDLTDQCDGRNRSERKAAECARLAGCSPEVQTIKVCDRAHNIGSIVEHDPEFAVVYLAESWALHQALTDARPAAWIMLAQVLAAAEAQLAEREQQ